MNTIEVFIKDETGQYKSIKGKANVVSFSFGELLDERLDEARLVIKNSTVEKYAPLTEVRIDIKKDGKVEKSLYMVIADPKSEEYPINKS